MKLICLLTHGLGDWYPPLSILPSIIKERNITDVKIYVDSVYFAMNTFTPQRETGIKMIEAITKNWEAVPSQYFGSGDWYGIPDRRLGPQYADVRYDFLFYRLPQLKEYMKGVLQRETEPYIFISGTGVWSYEWNGVENIPLDFFGREPLKFQVLENKEFLDEVIAEEGVLIHLRKKGVTITDQYFNELVNYINLLDKKAILIGLKNEVQIFSQKVHDFRETLSPEGIFYLIEKSEYMITSGSGYTFHRFFFNLPTVITLMEHNVDRHHCFHKEDLGNSNYLFLDADVPHINEIKEWLI